MTIFEYLESNCLGIRFVNHNSYIEILNNLIFFRQEKNVIIDRCLDIHGNCHLSYNKFSLESTLNVTGIIGANYYTIMAGSFVGMEVIDIKNKHINKMKINGYVMHNGVLS